MSNELKISAALQFLKGDVSVDSAGMGFGAIRITVSGTDMVQVTQAIATSATALDLGGITTPGFMLYKNITTSLSHTTMKMRMGSTGADFAEVRAGEIGLVRLASTNPYAISSGATGQLFMIIIED